MGVVNLALVTLLTEECELQQPDKSYAQIPQGENEIRESQSHDSSGSIDLHTEKPNKLVAAWTWFSNQLSQISRPTRSTMYKCA